MVAPETRMVVEVQCYGEVMDEMKVEVLRLVGGKLLEFQENYFRAWFGELAEGETLLHRLRIREKRPIAGDLQGVWLHLFSLRRLLLGQGEAVFQGPGAEPGTFSPHRFLP